MCDDHVGPHRKFKHSLTVLNHLSMGPGTRCGIHPGCDLNFFCMKDMIAVCHDCMALDHPPATHGVKSITEAAEKIGASLNGRIERYRQSGEEANSNIVAVRTARAVLLSNVDAANKQLGDVLEALAGKLEAHGKRMAAAIDDLRGERLKALDAQVDELLVRASQLGVGATLAENAIASRNPLKVASAVDAVKRMDALTTIPFNGPVVPPWLQLSCNIAAMEDMLRHCTMLLRVGVCLRFC